MKTQISRDSTRPEKRYSGVYQQQGRMITDADWNELTELAKRRLDDALTDVVASGVPRGERGLKITQNAAGDPLEVTAGHLYVDGVVAQVVAAPTNASPPETTPPQTFGLDAQADFPTTELPTGSPAGYQVYADVWERTVVSLEDDELRDAALHGADTCTRTQTMAQLKWCDEGLDPEDSEDNPQIGDARLTLELRAKSQAADPCDPCADLVAVDARTGNYLFRVEVHDVVHDASSPNTTTLTLKWSRENGAEQHRVDPDASPEITPPDEFKSGGWVYEFYNDSTEKHLGVHLTGGIAAERGKLVTGGYPDPPPAGYDRVRRWDGYGELVSDGSTWSPIGGRDRGTPLVLVAGPPDVHGEVELGDDLRIQLEHLALTLTLRTTDSPAGDHTFVAGDYWLAPIREAVHAVGADVLTAAAPAGVLHHYLRLARVDAGGALVEEDTDQLQRLAFPPLTDLQAGDVDYETECSSGLFDASHDTVEKALNQICEIAAEHVAYTTNCPSGLFDVSHDTVKKALDRVCEIAARHIAYQTNCPSGLFNASHNTVKKALDRVCRIAAKHVAFTKPCDTSLYQGVDPAALETLQDALGLLCDIRAEHIAYQSGECEDLNDATTVQEALDILCLRSSKGGCCRVTVGEGGEFERLGEAISALRAAGITDLCICLMPGDHDLRNGLVLNGKRDGGRPIEHLAIEGCGAGTRLHLGSGNVRFAFFASFALAGVEVRALETPVNSLALHLCQEVRVESSRFTSLVDDVKAPIRIRGAEVIRIEDNAIEAHHTAAMDLLAAVFEPTGRLGQLFKVPENRIFREQAEEQATELANLPFADRRVLASKVLSLVDGNADALGLEAISACQRFVNTLSDRSPVPRILTSVIEDVRWAAPTILPTHAVVLLDAAADTTIAGNDVTGHLSLYGPSKGNEVRLENQDVLRRLVGGLREFTIQLIDNHRVLRVRDNRLTSVVLGDKVIALINQVIENGQGTLGGIFETSFFTDNEIMAAGNQILCQHLNLTSARFQSALRGKPGALPPGLGWAIASSAVYVGNSYALESPVAPASRANFYSATLVPSEQAANLLLNIVE